MHVGLNATHALKTNQRMYVRQVSLGGRTTSHRLLKVIEVARSQKICAEAHDNSTTNQQKQNTRTSQVAEYEYLPSSHRMPRGAGASNSTG